MRIVDARRITRFTVTPDSAIFLTDLALWTTKLLLLSLVLMFQCAVYTDKQSDLSMKNTSIIICLASLILDPAGGLQQTFRL